MRLTRYTDYALRVLLQLTVQDERLVSIGEISRAYSISQNHLMKVVQDLSRAGFVTAVRGRNGGLRLGRRPEEIRIGDVVRHTEDGFQLVDCSTCKVAPACTLPRGLNEATRAFLAVLDRYTLADMTSQRGDLRALLGSPASMADAPE